MENAKHVQRKMHFIDHLIIIHRNERLRSKNGYLSHHGTCE